MRLPGRFEQFETGVAISQNWNRDYDTNLGRYIEADPLGIEAGQDVYVYVDGEPSRLAGVLFDRALSTHQLTLQFFRANARLGTSEDPGRISRTTDGDF